MGKEEAREALNLQDERFKAEVLDVLKNRGSATVREINESLISRRGRNPEIPEPSGVRICSFLYYSDGVEIVGSTRDEEDIFRLKPKPKEEGRSE